MNLWTFGCSFTNTWAPGSYFTRPNISWPSLVATKIGANLVNLGISGGSNEMIFDSVLSHLRGFRKNDIVIIMMTYGSRHTKKTRTRLEGLKANDKEYLKTIQTIGDIDYINNLRTMNTLCALNNLPIPNKYIFSIDCEYILKGMGQYNLSQSFFPNFHFWPKIDLKKHIRLSGPDGHPNDEEHKTMSKLIVNQLTKTNPEIKIVT